jgi:hypothetical protein
MKKMKDGSLYNHDKPSDSKNKWENIGLKLEDE